MPDDRGEHPVRLTIEAETPYGEKLVTVPIDATVGRVIDEVISVAPSERFLMEVPLEMEEDERVHYYPVDRDEPAIDALRGVQRPPMVVPEPGVEI